MYVDQPENTMINQFEDLFGKPPLLEGEDAERYQRLLTAVIRDLKPKTVFECFDAKDQVDNIWEEARCKRSAAALTEGAFKEALDFYLGPIVRQSNGIPIAISRQYFSTNSKEKKKADLFLAEHGVTIERIQAKAMEIVGGTLQMFDRMVNNRQSSRRMLRKDYERRLSGSGNIADDSGPAGNVGR
jgi:hypothetical protein